MKCYFLSGEFPFIRVFLKQEEPPSEKEATETKLGGIEFMFKAYQFHIQLLDSPTPVWRRFSIPAETNFKRLHDAIQIVMWWDDSHLAKFEDHLRKPTFRFVLSSEEIEEHKARLAYFKSKPQLQAFEQQIYEMYRQLSIRNMKNVKLPAVIESYPTFYYTYDYGDDWRHELTLEKIIDDFPHPYPMVTEWEGETPLEDVGGMAGNQMIQDILHNPAHPQHKEYVEASKDVQLYQVDKINFMLQEYVTVKRLK